MSRLTSGRALAVLCLCAAATLGAATASAAAEPSGDKLSRFFVWWNETFKQPGGYTAEAFGQWFTPDATLYLEGREVIRGLDGWAKHFQRIQAGGGDVEIVVPFKRAVYRDVVKLFSRYGRDGR